MLCKTYGQRPSRVMKIGDEWAAYQFDVAILEVGLQAEVEAADPSKKKVKKGLGGFRPSGVIRKGAVPESGIW